MNFATAFLALMACFIMRSQGFCIYNNVKTELGRETTYWLRQQPYNAGFNYFSRFANPSLKSGEKACCSYTNTDCVKSGKNDDEIYMVYRRTTATREHPPMVISLPSGGWIEFGGGEGPETETIFVYNPDGTPYDYKLRVDHQAGFT